MNRVILIVAPPSDLQIGLQALLSTHLVVDVLVTGVGSSALNVIKIHKPTIVILDGDLPPDTVSLIIHSVKSSYPDAVCIVMVNDEDDKPQMVDQGADIILLKGYPLAKLIKLLTNRLSSNQE
jgi:DNA-binding NarL/FixJ family response regulator